MLDGKKDTNPDPNERQKGFIKELIRMAFIYGHDKDLFHRKVLEAFRVDSLREKEVIMIDESLLSDDLREALYKQKLSEREIELCCLTAQGFSPDEISIILGLKNSNSVRVKQSRINKKIKASASPEAVWVMFCLSILLYIILTVLNAPGF